MTPDRAPYCTLTGRSISAPSAKARRNVPIRVRHVDHECDAAPAERVGSEVSFVRVLVGEHEHRVADAELGVADEAVGHDDGIAEQAGAEHLAGTTRWRGRRPCTRGTA